MLDTRALGRRPGSMRQVSLEVPAPDGLGVDVLVVPAGSPLDLDLRLESVMEGVLVTGTVGGPAEGQCVRCLDSVSMRFVVDLQELYAYPGDEQGDDDEGELRELEGDLIDLEPALRDAVVLALPLRPTCQVDCPGLCPQCGARLADDPAHTHEVADPRWAALQDLLDASPLEARTEER